MPWSAFAFVVAVLGVAGSIAGAAHAQVQIRFQEGTGASDFASAIANPGDLDGDGIDDMLVGHPGHAPRGRVWVYSGASGALIRTHDGSLSANQFGTTVAGVGDMDGDGVGDYVVGDPPVSGTVTAFSGAGGQALWSWTGFQMWNFGLALSGVGDVDGDGHSDVLVGSHGILKVLSATGSEITTLFGQTAGTEFSCSLAKMGDVDGDGVGDFAAGERHYIDLSRGKIVVGRVLVFSGATMLSISQSVGIDAAGEYGWSIANCGDLDGDSLDDLVVGAPFEDLGAGTNSGMVLAASSVTGNELFRQAGIGTGDLLGYRVASCGDVDLDGIPDFLAMAGGRAYGAVVLESGATGAQLWENDGAPLGSFGKGVASGNFDGDTVPDWVVGEPGYYDYSKSTFMGALYTYVGCPPRRSAFGAGWPGTNGTPSLSCTSGPAIGATCDVVVGNSTNASTLGLVLLGTADASIATPHGGTLLVDASSTFPIALSSPTTVLSAPLPDDVSLCFLDLFVQVLEADGGAAGGISFTEGPELTIGLDL
jgi:hypothetical protein